MFLRVVFYSPQILHFHVMIDRYSLVYYHFGFSTNFLFSHEGSRPCVVQPCSGCNSFVYFYTYITCLWILTPVHLNVSTCSIIWFISIFICLFSLPTTHTFVLSIFIFISFCSNIAIFAFRLLLFGAQMTRLSACDE